MRRAVIAGVLCFAVLAPALSADAEAVRMQAVKLEMGGRNAEAVPLYVQAARAGSAKAAARLAEIYDKGIPGVQPDRAESRKWQNAARTLGGERSQGGWGCPPKCPATTTK